MKRFNILIWLSIIGLIGIYQFFPFFETYSIGLINSIYFYYRKMQFAENRETEHFELIQLKDKEIVAMKKEIKSCKKNIG